MSEIFEQIKNKYKSDPEKLNKLKEVMAELQSIGKEYSNKFLQLQNIVGKEVARKEYSKGGEMMPRGYYCPSPVFEYVAGNVKRGILVKKFPVSGKYSYEYGFDKNDKLIRIKSSTEFEGCFYEEYLSYINESIVYSFEFGIHGNLNQVSKCTYENGKIIKYERGLYSDYKDIDDLFSEHYSYENNKLSEVNMYYNFIMDIGVFTKSRYLIDLDDNGNIIRLTGGDIVNGEWEKRVFNFSPKDKKA